MTELSEIFGLDLEKCQRVYESAIFTGEGVGRKKKDVLTSLSHVTETTKPSS